jgi:hypothetical protein
MNARPRLIIWIVILAALLAACSSPQMIAAYPKSTPIARYPAPPASAPHASLQVQVADVDRAAQRAVELAADHGGYASSSQSWYTREGKVVSLELVVPAVSFERLCRALLGLGRPSQQLFSSLPEPGRYGEPYIPPATIDLQLHPAPALWPPAVEPGDWRPLNTFQRAWRVFMSIFGFLVDVLIWIAVVVGPFVLIGLGAWAVIRRLRKPAPPAHNQPS